MCKIADRAALALCWKIHSLVGFHHVGFECGFLKLGYSFRAGQGLSSASPWAGASEPLPALKQNLPARSHEIALFIKPT